MRKATAASLSVLLVSSLSVPLSIVAFAENADAPAVVSETEEPAAMPEFKGSAVVNKFLNGGTPTLEELKTIDFAALRAWDAKIAANLKAMMDDLQAKEDAAKPGEGTDTPSTEPTDPTEPVDPADPTDPANPTDPVDPADPSKPSEPGDIPSNEAPEETVAPGASPSEAIDALPESQDPFDASISYPEWSYNGSTAFDMVRYTDDMDSQKFVAVIGEMAREVAAKYDVSASEMIGLALSLSHSGKSFYAQAPYRNLFDTKQYTEIDTTVYDESGIVDTSKPRVGYEFSNEICTYATYKDCLEDHAKRVAAGIEDAIPDDGTWGGAAGSLTKRVQDAIEAYDLTRFDRPLDYTTISPLTVTASDPSTGQPIQQEVTLADLVAEATSHLGVPYVWGGTTPSGFDCSGLVQYSYAHALQQGLPRTTYYQCLKGADVDFNDLHMGDLLFFTKDNVAGHVAMYLGDGCYIEAPMPGMQVKVTSMDEKMPAFAKRLIATQSVE